MALANIFIIYSKQVVRIGFDSTLANEQMTGCLVRSESDETSCGTRLRCGHREVGYRLW